MKIEQDDEHVTRDERRRRTQAAILTAARLQFGEAGFERTTIRSVAAGAGVDPALVMQYFGSKEALFAAAAHTDVRNEHVLKATSSDLPSAALRDVFSKFENPAEREAAVVLMRNCFTHPQATAILRAEVIGDAMTSTTPLIEAEEQELRSALFSACVMGLIAARYVVGVEPLASAPPEKVARLFEPALRALVSHDNGQPETDGEVV